MLSMLFILEKKKVLAWLKALDECITLILKSKITSNFSDVSSMDIDPVPQGGPSHGILDKKKMVILI